MNTRNLGLNVRLTAALTLLAVGGGFARAESVGISTSKDASDLERLAAQEVSRYVYLRTGALPGKTGQHGTIVIAQKNSPAITDEVVLTASRDLQAQQYVLKTTTSGNKKTWWIVGGDDTGTLYGAYRFVEKLGVRFYLHGDVIPDERLTAIPDMEETGKPLFALRGVNPWGSHPFGFDAWGTEDYKAIFSQLAKMRMNFLGIHCYPEGHPYAEPTVWLGTKDDFDAQGRVHASYASRYYSTLFVPGWGGYQAKKTSEYHFGGALLFEDDAWSPKVMQDYCPLPQTPEACNDVFNRTAAQFRDAFGFANRLGVKTCVGTESPLTLPKVLRERLKAQSKKPDDPATVREVYEGMFRRIAASHPLDYFWLWTPEGWTWGGNKPEQYSNTVSDIKLAIEALKNSGAPFKLATCGWVLGPQHDRAAFDNDLPKEIPMSAISRNTGATPVDPAFKNISGRDTWAIPWLESDNREGLAGVQLFVGRMRRDAADALAYGCTGLMGLQWRTDVLSPNAAALASAAWDQSGFAKTDAKWRVAGLSAVFPGREISGTKDDELYRSCRYDLGRIQLSAPNGPYKVTLKFCEPYFNKAQARVFDVQLQGITVYTNLDIFAQVGQFAALDFTYDNIAVTDGTLMLDLVKRTSLPCISAIAVEGIGFTCKLNCAGGACQDYQADAAKSRDLPCDDFYADWAQANFGVAKLGQAFAALDGRMPQVTDGGCPAGSLKPVATPWSVVAPAFAFVSAFEALRPSVTGNGNRERFDYWLNTFKYLRALAELRCALALPDAAEVTRLYAEAYRYLLATVNTPGGLGTVVTLENCTGWGPAVAKKATQPWPKAYPGAPRIIVPTVRSAVCKDEALNLTFIVLDNQPAKSVTVAWRPLGMGDFRRGEARLLSRATYQVKIPVSKESFEYRLEAETADGKTILWPATAPEMNQTVVVW
jgi:hypothetical protein